MPYEFVSAASTVRWIRGRRRIDVNVQLQSTADSGRIALAVAAVIRTASGHILTLWRLRELPDFRELHTTLCGTWRPLWECAARRGWASVVDRPVGDGSASGTLPDIFGSHHIAAIGCRHPGTINPHAKSGREDAVNPGKDVGPLLGQHATTLLLIEKNNGGARKAFARRRHSGGLCIRLPKTLGVGHRFQLSVEPAIE